MTTKDLDKFFKRANKVINSYEDKLSVLDYDYFIVSNIVFTSDADYYYCFSVFKDNQVIEKIAVDKASDYSKTFKDLTIKYKTNVIHNYNDLTTSQLNYLDSVDDDNINKDEVANLLFKKQFELFE